MSRGAILQAEEDFPIVWVVDDDDLFRDALVALLTAHGFDAIGFENGAAAWNALESGGTAPRAIILDKRMPHMDGVEFRQRQMSDARVSMVPVIVVTGESIGAAPLPGTIVMSKETDPDVLVTLLGKACAPRRFAYGGGRSS